MLARLLLFLLLASWLASAAAESPSQLPATAPAAQPEENRQRDGLKLLHKARDAALASKPLALPVDVLRRVAEEQASAGDLAAGRETIAKTKEAARKLQQFGSGDSSQSRAFFLIVYAEIDVGDLKSARATAGEIWDVATMNDALRAVGIAQAEAGDIDSARATAAAIRSSDPSKVDYVKGAVIWAVAAAEAKRGDRDKAWETIDAIEDPKVRLSGLCSLAEAQARVKDIEGARTTIARITLDTPHGRKQQSEALHAVARTQIAAGDFAAAAASAAEMGDKSEAQNTILEIAQAQAARGNVAAVESTIAQLGDNKDAQIALITARAYAGDIAGATAAAKELPYSWNDSALRLIASAQIKGGDFGGARATLEQTLGGEETGTLLCDLALAQLASDRDAARSSISDAKLRIGRHGYRLEYRVAEAYARAGDFGLAEMVARSITDYASKRKAFARIAVERAVAKGFEDAVQWTEKQSDASISAMCFLAVARERLNSLYERTSA